MQVRFGLRETRKTPSLGFDVTRNHPTRVRTCADLGVARCSH